MKQTIRIRQLFVSGGHRFVGQHGKKPREFEMEERSSIECLAGKGIIGDRFFDYKEDYKGQLTFFSEEVFLSLSAQFAGVEKCPSVLRRNIIVSGVDLNGLIGRRFCLGELELLGTEEASPCYWMNQAFCEGAEEALRGRGGLRAKILTGGALSQGEQELTLLD